MAHSWTRELLWSRERAIDRGVTQWKARMGGQPCVTGTRLPLRFVKRFSRSLMRDFGLSDQQIEDVIRYWKVRGFEKVR